MLPREFIACLVQGITSKFSSTRPLGNAGSPLGKQAAEEVPALDSDPAVLRVAKLAKLHGSELRDLADAIMRCAPRVLLELNTVVLEVYAKDHSRHVEDKKNLLICQVKASKNQFIY